MTSEINTAGTSYVSGVSTGTISVSNSRPTSLYVNGNYPMWLYQALVGAQTPQTVQQQKYWKSKPRLPSDPHIEVLYVKFRQPVVVTSISFELLQVSQSYALWYLDRLGNRKQLLDKSLTPIAGKVNTGAIGKWYKISSECFPVFATQVELRLTRVPDGIMSPTGTYTLAVRNLLIKREIRKRKDCGGGFEPVVDILGSIVSKTVLDFAPLQALDGSSFTYWKSEPQGDPAAVVWYAIDCRDINSNPVKIDTFWLDPLYTGQDLNVYYSNDDTVGVRELGNTLLAPSIEIDCYQVQGFGLYLNNPSADYEIPVSNIGFVPGKSFWIGLVWNPQFASTTPPPAELILFQDTNSPNVSIQISYGHITGKLKVYINNVILAESSAAISFQSNDEIQIAVGVTYSQDANSYTGLTQGIQLIVSIAGTTSVVNYVGSVATLNLVNTIKFSNVQGYIQYVILKQEAPVTAFLNQFLSDPSVYLTPDPTVSNQQGQLPQTTLSNAIFGCDYTQNQLPYGGLDSESFAEKIWTPILQDFTTTRGFYYLKKPINAKYLKLEFSNLTEEQYTIYESDLVAVGLRFPASVRGLRSVGKKLYATANTSTPANPRSSVDPRVARSVGSAFSNVPGDYPQDTDISLGLATVTDNVPNTYLTPTSTDMAWEATSSVVYRRPPVDARLIAQAKYNEVQSGQWLPKLNTQNYLSPGIADTTSVVLNNDSTQKALPQRTPGSWVFPGQNLQLPASVMNQITNTSTITERKQAPLARVRFPNPSKHVYEMYSVTRDAAIAYFAGLRQVEIFRVLYEAANDTPSYNVQQLDDVDFTLTNLQTFETGASSILTLGTNGEALSNVWLSTSEFIKIQLDGIGRTPQRPVEGIDSLQPIGLGGGVGIANWSDPSYAWADTVAVWGASEALVNIDFQSNYNFGGVPAVLIERAAGAGSAGVINTETAIVTGTLVRVGIQIYPVVTPGNTYTLQLVDRTQGNAVVFEQNIVPVAGQWNNIVTIYNILQENYTNVSPQLLINGSFAETDYVGDLYVEISTISYQVSNNGGVNFYDATAAATANVDGETNSDYFLFPSLGNQLQVKIVMMNPLDFVYGFTLVPFYLD